MTINLYFDEHVPDAITAGLRRRGVDVLTVQEDFRRGMSDVELLNRAAELGRVFFTQDEDFLAEGARRQATGETFAGIVYAHALRVSIGQCIRDLELLAGAGRDDEFVNAVLHLPLR